MTGKRMHSMRGPATSLTMLPMDLVRPAPPYLTSYSEALSKGWSPDNTRDVSGDELRLIAQDPARFLDSLTDPEAKGPPITLPDGSQARRLPGFRLWMWDGDFCGSIGLRWQPGTSELPPYCLGHIGYAVVPWKAGRGYATRALGLLLPMARERGLDHVDLTTDPDNIPSQRVILANGGVLQGQFRKPAHYGNADGLLYRVDLRTTAR